MRPLNVSNRILLAALACIAMATTAFGASQKKVEYFTESEIDIIREEQTLERRIPVFFKFADARLTELGVSEKSKAQLEQERKERELKEKEQREKEAQAAARPGTTPRPAPKPKPKEPILADFTPTELLRGYIEALEEAMDNIDGAHSDRREVRGVVEALDKYATKALPTLEKFRPATSAEKTAFEDAIAATKHASAGARDALKSLPKTEQKSNSR